MRKVEPQIQNCANRKQGVVRLRLDEPAKKESKL